MKNVKYGLYQFGYCGINQFSFNLLAVCDSQTLCVNVIKKLGLINHHLYYSNKKKLSSHNTRGPGYCIDEIILNELID